VALGGAPRSPELQALADDLTDKIAGVLEDAEHAAA
jgi:hypothetical protein